MNELYHKIECLLFVAGEPVPIAEIGRVLQLDEPAVRQLLSDMEACYRAEGRGIQLLSTEESAQLVSNRDYASLVEELLQPQKRMSVSQSILETLAIIAYRQPVTRADIEEVRGVRCEYALSQLQRMGLVTQMGRKDVVGRPMLYGTTDTFLHRFGLHCLSELPDYLRHQQNEEALPELPAV